MPSFRLDPYLWVHLAGLAAVPLWLDICLLGLATGGPVLSVGVEIAILTLLGALPVLWMQWQKPFCIYSLVFLALRPAAIDEPQRQTLRLFRGLIPRLIALVVPVPLVLTLGKIYEIAPVAAETTPFPNRTVGFLAAAIAFLLANLFTQVPASVLKVLLTSEKAWAKRTPYLPEEIPRNFTLIGLPVKKILPALTQPVLSATPQSLVNTAPESALKDSETADKKGMADAFDFPEEDWESPEASEENVGADDWAEVGESGHGDVAEESDFFQEDSVASGEELSFPQEDSVLPGEEPSEIVDTADSIETTESESDLTATEFPEPQEASDDVSPVIEAEFLNCETALAEDEPAETSTREEEISESSDPEIPDVEALETESTPDVVAAETENSEVAVDQMEALDESNERAEPESPDDSGEENHPFSSPEKDFPEK
ncbi:hypothetical protein C7271_07175 [filamentous cyanobacterium CCP5]|nr:hypothetical protein C7271_07175 [filamentous cyanobacterium CCP5]